MSSTSKQVKISFEADPGDWHGMAGERLWATELGNGHYRIDNVPLYVNGVSYGDIVSAKPEDGSLAFGGVVRPGGNSTYRMLLRSPYGRRDFERYWARLEPLGCFYESSRDPEDVFAINVPSEADVHAVYAILEEGAAEGVWHFDEGNFEHPPGEATEPGQGR
jgi:Domain of unknown function (DUF4265)